MNPQPRYFPFLHGVYDVKAGIESLGRDHGNGDADGRVFQLDDTFPAYRACKLAATRDPGRHILREGLPPATEQAIGQWAADRLAAEYPQHFGLADGRLSCALTGDRVDLHDNPALLDALALQVQSDWAVLELDANGGNRVSYLHISMPSGWPPEEKIGRPFDAIHKPVPHIEAINAKQAQVAKLMVNATRGAVRFAWTVTTDAALNHHPLAKTNPAGDPHKARSARDVAPPEVEAPPPPESIAAQSEASGLPGYTPGEPLLRVERQVIWGFPEHRASLFTIRTYRYTLADLDAPARSALTSAVAGMSAASLRYKNMDREQILDWLAGSAF